MLELHPPGLYSRNGDFYIDPLKSVGTAVITHAHSDHARRGSQRYICTPECEPLLRARLGSQISTQTYRYHEPFQLGNVKLSFHPAGHILGSAQVRMELEGEIWVASGDYKRDADPTCEPFEVVPCDVFVTEATFGTPRFAWKKEANLGQSIADWWKANAAQGLNSIIYAYSLGKAQRVLGELGRVSSELNLPPVLTHPTVSKITECYTSVQSRLALWKCLSLRSSDMPLSGELLIIPPSADLTPWQEALGEFRTAFASGWTAYGNRNYDHGFLMSDHADWNDLLETVRQTGAQEVYTMHRDEGMLVRHLRKNFGITAHPLSALAPGKRRKTERQLQLF